MSKQQGICSLHEIYWTSLDSCSICNVLRQRDALLSAAKACMEYMCDEDSFTTSEKANRDTDLQKAIAAAERKS